MKKDITKDMPVMRLLYVSFAEDRLYRMAREANIEITVRIA